MRHRGNGTHQCDIPGRAVAEIDMPEFLKRSHLPVVPGSVRFIIGIYVPYVIVGGDDVRYYKTRMIGS